MGRQSSAYGYSQALDGTWDEYVEEVGGWGSQQLVKGRDLGADRAVVGEPTSNRLLPGHRGRIILQAHIQGESRHGSNINPEANPLFSLAGSRAAVWHAVEHKSIAAYEQGGPREVANAAEQPKEHRRCGSNLVLPLMVSTVAGNLALHRLRGGAGPAARVIASAASAGLAVEWFAFAHRNPEHPLARVVHASGHALQAGLATREPDADDLVVGGAAMRALFAAEGIRD